MERPAEIARRWLEAITRGDEEALREASDERIEIHGPEGVGVGHEVMAVWFETSPMRIVVKRMAERGEEVLVHHHIDWIGPGGQSEGSIDNAALIGTRGGKVASYRRVADAGAIASGFTPVPVDGASG